MPAIRKCRGCGEDVPANAPFGHCPKCLLELGFGPPPEGIEAPSPAAPVAGRFFADYELLDQIGRGGMGVIYKARQRALNRQVALKMIGAGEFASPTLIQRFHIEAEAAANLHHPNIVPIYETGEHQGQHFFSMELIDGAGVDRYITGSGFCFGKGSGSDKASLRARHEQVARILAKVARAVDYAHQHGVLHRDIKPSNVILDHQGEPHLTDFGVAKVIGYAGSGLTASGAIMGTPSYMAPEQAAGQSKRVTTAADIYSLGAILYQMLTGQPPFRADTPVETLKQVVEQEPKHPTTFSDGVDRDLATICMKCLEKEPQRRYSSAAALADDLERWSRKEPIQARPAHTTERLWRWCRRNPRVAALGGAVALLLVLLTLGSMVAAVVFAAQREVIRRTVVQGLVEVYDGRRPFYEVPSAMRRALTTGILDTIRRAVFGRRTEVPSGSSLEIYFVEHVYERPTNMLISLAPILNDLEEELSDGMHKTVEIHMRLLQRPNLTYATMESTNAVFGRMGPASFAHLESRSNGVRLLAMQDHKKPLTVAIYARTNSEVGLRAALRPGIPLLTLLSNRSLALTHSNSTTGNFMAKWLLVTNGVYATKFSGYDYLGSQSKAREAVLANAFDVGAGNLDIVEGDSRLVVLAKAEVEDLGRCWVAGRGLDATIEEHLRQCLLKLKDPGIIGQLESEVRGFKLLNPQALERLRKIMRDAEAFDPTQ